MAENHIVKVGSKIVEHSQYIYQYPKRLHDGAGRGETTTADKSGWWWWWGLFHV